MDYQPEQDDGLDLMGGDQMDVDAVGVCRIEDKSVEYHGSCESYTRSLEY